jgi:uncharacterized caspase-like protein
MADGDYALVMGIGSYPRLKPLEGPAEDAGEFIKWLEGPGGVPHIESVVTHDGDQPPDRPALEQIDEAFDRILARARREGARRLYVYFAGHGAAQAIDHVALLMANADMDNLNRAINAPEYHSGLAKKAIFPEQVFFYDCCRNYDKRVRGRNPEWTDDAPAPTAGNVTQFLLFGAAFTEYANERRMIYSTKRGLFTRALLEGLNGGAATLADSGWTVFSSHLTRFVDTRLKELAADENLSQELGKAEVGRPADLVLAAGVTPWQQTVTVSAPGGSGMVVVKDGKLVEVTRVPLVNGRANVKLVPNWYVFQLESSGLTESQEVKPGVPTRVVIDG